MGVSGVMRDRRTAPAVGHAMLRAPPGSVETFAAELEQLAGAGVSGRIRPTLTKKRATEAAPQLDGNARVSGQAERAP
jgi:hypothetical protein